ncbi:MAG: RNA polymerase sigma factor [Bacteroidota bacterium]|jgi:RNA polymerase sigma factor (sigma-70 family)
MDELTPKNPEQINPKLTPKGIYDYSLICRALQTKDEKAYAELMGRYKDSVYFMLLKMVRNVDDAEDLTLEAFGKAFKNLHQYSTDFAFSTWLFKIASNCAIDFLRKKKNEGISYSLDKSFENEDGEESRLQIKDGKPDPEENMIKKQKIDHLRGVIQQLKPSYRNVIELYYFEELSYEEISSKTGLTISTIKIQLFRSRELLQNILKNTQNNL